MPVASPTAAPRPARAARSIRSNSHFVVGRFALLDPLELPFDMQVILDSLKPKQKTLLWLAYVEGFTHHEIADVVGVNASSVRVLLSRARAELAGKLGDERAAYRAAGEGAR